MQSRRSVLLPENSDRDVVGGVRLAVAVGAPPGCSTSTVARLVIRFTRPESPDPFVLEAHAVADPDSERRRRRLTRRDQVVTHPGVPEDPPRKSVKVRLGTLERPQTRNSAKCKSSCSRNPLQRFEPVARTTSPPIVTGLPSPLNVPNNSDGRHRDLVKVPSRHPEPLSPPLDAERRGARVPRHPLREPEGQRGAVVPDHRAQAAFKERRVVEDEQPFQVRPGERPRDYRS